MKDRLSQVAVLLFSLATGSLVTCQLSRNLAGNQVQAPSNEPGSNQSGDVDMIPIGTKSVGGYLRVEGGPNEGAVVEEQRERPLMPGSKSSNLHIEPVVIPGIPISPDVGK